MQTVRAPEIPLSRRSSCRAAWNVWTPGPGREIVEAYSIPTAYFQVNGSHTFLVSEDHTFGWPNAGSGWFDTYMGEDKTRRIVAIQAVYIGWLIYFSPPDGDQYKFTGIKFGLKGVCHTITGGCCLASMNATCGP